MRLEMRIKAIREEERKEDATNPSEEDKRKEDEEETEEDENKGEKQVKLKKQAQIKRYLWRMGHKEIKESSLVSQPPQNLSQKKRRLQRRRWW